MGDELTRRSAVLRTQPPSVFSCADGVRETIRASRAIWREDGVNYWLVPDALMPKLREVIGPPTADLSTTKTGEAP